MTDILVLDETDQHQELREQVETILSRFAPLMPMATGLELPQLVCFRIVPVETWQSEQTAEKVQLLREYRELMPYWKRPLVGLGSALVVRISGTVSADLGGVLVMGASQRGMGAGESQTLLVPEALHHTGLLTDPKYLTQMVVHELVHHAQNRASGHRRAWAADDPGNLIRGNGVELLEEGHAFWADQAIVRQGLGEPCDVYSAPKSPRYEDAIQGKMVKLLAPDRDRYNAGRLLVESAIEAVGTQRFNQVWTTPELLPSKAELEDAVAALAADPPSRPLQWATRLDLAENAETGVHPVD
ncbi:zinc-dependent metalloprotease [Streptomyces griseus]|uniref:zinc-dependent metalloprotease n=1 Tax=Streptomyces griseus TaxID=1911 RepID=UPI0037A36CA7